MISNPFLPESMKVFNLRSEVFNRQGDTYLEVRHYLENLSDAELDTVFNDIRSDIAATMNKDLPRESKVTMIVGTVCRGDCFRY